MEGIAWEGVVKWSVASNLALQSTIYENIRHDNKGEITSRSISAIRYQALSKSSLSLFVPGNFRALAADDGAIKSPCHPCPCSSGRP